VTKWTGDGGVVDTHDTTGTKQQRP
jgi:hypothetical protein